MWRPSYERLSLWRTRFMFILLHPDTKLTVSNYMQAVTVADFHTEWGALGPFPTVLVQVREIEHKPTAFSGSQNPQIQQSVEADSVEVLVCQHDSRLEETETCTNCCGHACLTLVSRDASLHRRRASTEQRSATKQEVDATHVGKQTLVPHALNNVCADVRDPDWTRYVSQTQWRWITWRWIRLG